MDVITNNLCVGKMVSVAHVKRSETSHKSRRKVRSSIHESQNPSAAGTALSIDMELVWPIEIGSVRSCLVPTPRRNVTISRLKSTKYLQISRSLYGSSNRTDYDCEIERFRLPETVVFFIAQCSFLLLCDSPYSLIESRVFRNLSSLLE